jgi:hypothetical protein
MCARARHRPAVVVCGRAHSLHARSSSHASTAARGSAPTSASSAASRDRPRSHASARRAAAPSTAPCDRAPRARAPIGGNALSPTVTGCACSQCRWLGLGPARRSPVRARPGHDLSPRPRAETPVIRLSNATAQSLNLVVTELERGEVLLQVPEVDAVGRPAPRSHRGACVGDRGRSESGGDALADEGSILACVPQPGGSDSCMPRRSQRFDASQGGHTFPS